MPIEVVEFFFYEGRAPKIDEDTEEDDGCNTEEEDDDDSWDEDYVENEDEAYWR
jgi:hypothetical protein